MIKVTKITESYYDYFKQLFEMSLAKEFGVGDNPPDDFRDLEEVQPTNGTFILTDDADVPIGYSQFGVTYNKTAWFSLFIDPRAQGKGYGRAAFETLTEILFSEHDIKTIIHNTMISNCKMMKIIEDFGCRRCGEVRHRALSIGNSKERINTSCVQYELTIEDYLSKKEELPVDSRLSYGIDNPDFLDFEKKRLLLQSVIQVGPLERQLLEVIPKINSPVIMDLGCGLGNLIHGLSASFKEAHFIGVDTEPEFIRIAEESTSTDNTGFLNKSIFELNEELKNVDIFLMRIVAQHIGSEGVVRFFEAFKKYAKPSAKILILDIDDKSWNLNPSVAGFDLLLASCNFNQKKYGGDRLIGSKCKDLAIENELNVDVFQVCPFDSHNIGLNNFSGIIEALFKFKADSSYLAAHDIETIRSNFDTWRKNEKSFGYGCLFLTQIGKNA
jgi:RimJ/RimL family protein N-acetyltransferase/2-polyprenyl-3-methyl-5-hydroxy-6-metoxy-1,4-benzoquinol methylase